MKNKDIKIIYIAGNGHSGSTLLDIIIGSSPDIFSSGELTFITRDTILREYCSCGDKISNCEVWSEIMKRWLAKSSISLDQYKKLRLKFERSKTTLSALKNSISPSNQFLEYCDSTRILFEAISDVTGKKVIVDSSKSPQRIPVLKRVANLNVLHICRNVKGVLNSAKKTLKKNIEAGIEADVAPRRTWKTFTEWVFVNFVTELFCIGVKSKKVFYEKYINDPSSLEALDENIKIDSNLFSTDHMIAGNSLRLKKNIKISPEIGFHYPRLTKRQRVIATVFDVVFFFWHK